MAEANTVEGKEPRRCLNCGAALAGDFCNACGQSGQTRIPTVPGLLGEFIDGFFSFDSRTWRTLIRLVTRPGQLTVDYLSGRRASYVAPFKLYLSISLTFFILQSLDLGPSSEADPREVVSAIGAEIRADIAEEFGGGVDGQPQAAETDAATAPPGAAAAAIAPATTVVAPEPGATAPSTAAAVTPEPESTGASPAPSTIESCGDAFALVPELARYPGLLERCERIVADPGAFGEAIVELIPTLLFVLFPLMALFLKVLYPLSGRLYIEHLIHLFHLHSFVFFVVLASAIATWIRNIPYVSAGLGLLVGGLWLYTFFYVYRSLRVVYGQSRIATIVKYFCLAGLYFCAFLLTTLGGVLFSIVTLA